MTIRHYSHDLGPLVARETDDMTKARHLHIAECRDCRALERVRAERMVAHV